MTEEATDLSHIDKCYVMEHDSTRHSLSEGGSMTRFRFSLSWNITTFAYNKKEESGVRGIIPYSYETFYTALGMQTKSMQLALKLILKK